MTLYTEEELNRVKQRSSQRAYDENLKKGGYCRAGRDGDCEWEGCPQLRDHEPSTTGRSCPLKWWEAECDR